MIDPDARTLEAYQNQQGQWLLLATFAEDAAEHIAPFDAIKLELSLLWAD